MRSDESESEVEDEISTSESDGDLDDELGVSVEHVDGYVKDLATIIAHNEAYLFLISKLTKKVELLLETNREQQRKLKHLITEGVLSSGLLRIQKNVFDAPYFKDIHGMVPVSNEESRAIQRECQLNVLMKESRVWSVAEIETLQDAVFTQVMEQNLAEASAKKQLLREEIKGYHAEDKIEQLKRWKLELETVERRIHFLGNIPPDELLSKASYESIDWARISATDFRGTRTIMQLKMKWLNELDPKWNRGEWEENEVKELLSMAQSPWINWDFVAEKLGTSRAPYHCFEKFVALQKQNREKRPWTSAEDEKLLSLIQTFRFGSSVNWARVAAHMPGRNRFQCENRYTRTLDSNVKHGRWTEAEDMVSVPRYGRVLQLLLSAVNKYGPQDWNRVADQVPSRSSLQCRSRWMDVLDSKRSSAPWSVEEDEVLLIGVQIFGRSNYSKISKLLPGRNASCVKNRVRTLLRWKIAAVIADEDNDNVKDSYIVHKDNKALQKFNDIMKISNSLNQRGIQLAKRLGYGTYVVNETGEQVCDYSVGKREHTNTFGCYYMTKSGKWCRVTKNPNEFGAEELAQELDQLEPEKKKILTDYMENRRQREENMTDAENDDTLLMNVSKLMADALAISEKDIQWFHKQNMCRKKNNAKKFKVFRRPSKRTRRSTKRRRVIADFSSFIADLAPRRYTVADRVTDEVCYKEDRRNFIISSMADSIARHMEEDTKASMNQFMREILQSKVNIYLSEELGRAKCETLLLNDMNNVKNGLDMIKLLSNLIPPNYSTVNGALFYRDFCQNDLINSTKRIFSSITLSDGHEEQTMLDMRLSKSITNSSDYLILKQRVFRMFLLPMLMKRAMESKQTVMCRANLRDHIKKRRQDLENELKNNGIVIKEGKYWDEVSGEPVSLAKVNELFPTPSFFDNSLAKELFPVPATYVRRSEKRARFKPPVSTGSPLLGDVLTSALDPGVVVGAAGNQGGYCPRWALRAAVPIEVMTTDQLKNLTVKQLMTLSAKEKERLTHLIRSMPEDSTSTGEPETAKQRKK